MKPVPTCRVFFIVFITWVLLLSAGCAISPEPLGDNTAGRDNAQDIALQRLPQVGNYYATAVSGDYAHYPALTRFIERMTAQYGYSREYLNGLFSQVRRKQWTIEYMNRQAPPAAHPAPGVVVKPSPGGWARYRSKFLDELHIGKGAAFWVQHAAALQQASERYGIPPEYILGIMGVETVFGGNMGNHRVIDALTTLAFDYPRRADYFTEELANFLVMTRKEGLDPAQPLGSFAGAMGFGQFMPSSFLRWAVDFDGDGRCNLWNPKDAIGSIARYFSEHGWRPGEPVVTAALTSKDIVDGMQYGFDTHYSLDLLKQAGVTPLQACPTEDVRLLRLSGHKNTEYWLGHQNFYVLTRYNNSTHYAMAVHQLAQAIKERYKGTTVGQR